MKIKIINVLLIIIFLTCIHVCLAQESQNGTVCVNATSNNATTLSQPLNPVTMYVAPRNELPVRTGKGFKYRIIAILRDGSKVTLIKTDGDWAYIRLQDGREGWVLKRYLSKEIPLKQQIAKLKQQNQELLTKLTNANKTISDLQNKLDTLTSQNSILKNKLDYITNAYTQLKHDAANVISLKKAYESSQRELQQAKQQIVILETQNNHLKNSDRIKWFLAGAAVLLIGWLIGLIMGRGRRRRSSLTLG